MVRCGGQRRERVKDPKDFFQDRITGKMAVPFTQVEKSEKKKRFKEEKFNLRNTEFEMTSKLCIIERSKLNYNLESPTLGNYGFFGDGDL